MGQYFHLLAPHAKLAILRNYKLSEMVFDPESAALISDALAIAVRHNVCEKEHSSISDYAQDVISALPPRSKKRKTSANPSVPKPEKSPRPIETSFSLFLGLPTEIHRQIFASCAAIEEILKLALVNRYLCRVARGFVREYLSRSFGSWANQSIVAVSDYSQPGDYPDGMFSDQEWLEYSTANYKLFIESEHYDAYDLELADFSLYHCSKLFQFNGELTLEQRCSRILAYMQTLPISDAAVMKESLGLSADCLMKDSEYLPADEPWVLLNLSTKEFVRSEVFGTEPELRILATSSSIILGHVVLSRIVWADARSVSGGYSSICRGP